MTARPVTTVRLVDREKQTVTLILYGKGNEKEQVREAGYLAVDRAVEGLFRRKRWWWR